MTGPPTLRDFFAAWDLFRDAALAGGAAGAALGLVGVYVVLRRMVFLTAAVSQAAGLGVTLGLWARAALGAAAPAALPTAGSFALTLGALLAVARDREGKGLSRDALLGFVWLAGAAGTLAVGSRVVEDLADIDTLLFGSAVAVLPGDLALVGAAAAGVLLVHAWWWRGFAAASFDAPGARVRGLPVRRIDAVLMVTLAVAISASTRVLGALPTFAFSVLPAIAAVRLARSLPAALACGAAAGAASGLVGYLVAFRYELPVGAAQTLTAAGIAAGVELVLRARPASVREKAPGEPGNRRG